MSKIKLECHEANHVCDKNQYKEAKFLDKLKLIIHLMYCRACRDYTKKNGKLTKLIKKNEAKTLDNDAKSKINLAFQKELAKHK